MLEYVSAFASAYSQVFTPTAFALMLIGIVIGFAVGILPGLGGPETAASILGKEKVMVGVVGGFGASIKAPGHAHHNGMELVRLGEFGGPITPRLRKVEDAWKGAGFKVKVFDDIDQLVWEKLICNCAYSGPCALADCTSALPRWGITRPGRSCGP